jgi:hypothetical protein
MTIFWMIHEDIMSQKLLLQNAGGAGAPPCTSLRAPMAAVPGEAFNRRR